MEPKHDQRSRTDETRDDLAIADFRLEIAEKKRILLSRIDSILRASILVPRASVVIAKFFNVF
jgi:hypothetical protein